MDPKISTEPRNIESLPDELLLGIIENVSNLDRPGSWGEFHMRRTYNLLPLVLTSRRFNRIVTPLLYENIQAPRYRTSRFWESIVTTLKLNPTLRQYVKQIHTPPYQPMYANPSPSDLRSVLPWDLVTDLHHQSPREFEKRNKQGDNILLTFLVLQAPNLESLVLRGFEDTTPHYSVKLLPLVVEELGRLLYADLELGTVPRRFESLRTLWLDLGEWGFFPARAVLPFLVLPQLKSLTLFGWGGEENRQGKRFDLYGDARQWPLRSSPLEELYLYGVTATYSMVTELISSCTALKVFDCTLQIHRDQNLFQWHKHVSNALLDHASSLDKVSILEPELQTVRAKDCFEHSSSMICLKDLRLPYNILIGNNEAFNIPPEKASEIAQHLPPSLERLVVDFRRSGHSEMWQDINDIVTRIAEALANARVAGSLPNLKGVEIMLDDDQYGLLIPTFRIEAFRTLLSAQQVTLDVSLVCAYPRHDTPTRDDMRSLKRTFPAFALWCRSHRILKASTCKGPCIPRYHGAPAYANDSPYYSIYNPWDFENEDETAEV